MTNLKKQYLNTFLKDEINNIHAIGDYTGINQEFSYTNEIKQKLYITKLTITIEDNAIFRSNSYGRDIKLENGVKLYYTNAKHIKSYIIGNDFPIKKNKNWLLYGCQVDKKDFSQGSKFLQVIFDFTDNYIILHQNEKISFELSDDFNSLEDQVFNIQGYYL